jgi:hypothetical protein
MVLTWLAGKGLRISSSPVFFTSDMLLLLAALFFVPFQAFGHVLLFLLPVCAAAHGLLLTRDLRRRRAAGRRRVRKHIQQKYQRYHEREGAPR